LEIVDNRITALVARIAVNNTRVDELESKLAALTKVNDDNLERLDNRLKVHSMQHSELAERVELLSNRVTANYTELSGQVYKISLSAAENATARNDFHDLFTMQGQKNKELKERASEIAERLASQTHRVNHLVEFLDLSMNKLIQRVSKLELKTLGGVRASPSSVRAYTEYQKWAAEQLEDASDEIFDLAVQKGIISEPAAAFYKSVEHAMKTPSNTPDTQPSGDERPDQDIQ
jgi:chromosome segregation ATPase